MIISFVLVTSHRGEYLSKALENSLIEWKIRNVFSVTVDSASSNDATIRYFKKKNIKLGASFVKLKFLHMRCIAHIMNLIVNDGLKEVNVSIKKVREAIRYIRSSLDRLRKFKEISELIDVPTR